jgi:cholesterol oxidase
MQRLSLPLDRMRPHYDVVIIGSGYGGAVCASRLARAGKTVCVLERGKEMHPGEYPSTPAGFAGEVQAALPSGQLGARSGLYRFHVDDDIGVITGCGLGGTSLINAGVVRRPDPEVMDDPCWPAELRADEGGLLARGFERAEAMLRPLPYPDRSSEGKSTPRLPKLDALEAAARAVGGSFTRTRLAVTFEAGTSPAGIRQPACKLCGDCLTGCNHGAKSSLLVNYLPDARQHGAELFTCVDVARVERRGDRWVVLYTALDVGRERFDTAPAFVSADVVVLAAGALGSTEILLRSRAAGLPLSDRLGHRFSGNGCAMGFGYDLDREVRSVGWGATRAEDAAPVGPAIAGNIELRDPRDPARTLLVQETSIPGALGALMAQVLAAAAPDVPDRTARARLGRSVREWSTRIGGPQHGAMRNTQVFAVTAHDDAGGACVLEDDRLRVRWPGAGLTPATAAVHQRLEELTTALGGTYVPNPAWRDLPNHPPMTPHPMGGCAMGAAAEGGVVDHQGRVFCADRGTEVHDGLYVCDGSILPRSLGCNPLLTITALSERCAELLARQRGWSAARHRPRHDLPAAPEQRARRSVGYRFTERMEGHLETPGHSGTRSGFGFVLTVSWDDLDALIRDPSIEARTTGTVRAPSLHPEPLAVSEGRFRLFVPHGEPGKLGERETFRMWHHAVLRDRAGRAYLMEGHKEIHDDPGPDLWTDTTTLFFTLREGADGQGPSAGKGVVRVRLLDLMKQIGTMTAVGAADRGADLRGRGRFIGLFLERLHRVYGGALVLPLVS